MRSTRDRNPDVTHLGASKDAGDQRVLKLATDQGSEESHTAYVFETLELRRATFAGGDYELSEWTEVPYLFANGVRLARVVWHEPGEVPSVGSSASDAPERGRHVLLELGDHLGSTSVVLDQATGELVERATFYAYGGTESDYRPERWREFRSDYRFTGKEQDVEVGLTYFGKRYLNAQLGRWVSADPLGVHSGGLEADLNVYAYVHGYVLRAIDPVGLDDDDGIAAAGGASSGGSGGSEGASAGDASTEESVLTWYADMQKAEAQGGGFSAGVAQRVNENVEQLSSLYIAACEDPVGTYTQALTESGPGPVVPIVEFVGTLAEDIGMANAVAWDSPGSETEQKLGYHATGVAFAVADLVMLRASLKTPKASSGATDLPDVPRYRLKSSPTDPGLDDLPFDVGVPMRAGEMVRIPRALTDREMAALMNTSGNIEFSQVYIPKPEGAYYGLTRASHSTPNRVRVLPLRSGSRWISHTHPADYSSAPSPDDALVLKALGQENSRIVYPSGLSIRF